ncbi:MAG: hypothetical protein OEZ58_18120 [Gammaproteobacteria bacterium]|nr:hypothetical protein [Gammaproteobacteria bacterium]
MSLIDLLYEWQTLVGAGIGGVFALVAAIYVAYDARFRETRVAFVQLLNDLVIFTGLWDQYQKHLEDIRSSKYGKLNKERSLALQVAFIYRNFRKISSLTTLNMIRVGIVDPCLNSHLTLFFLNYNAFVERLDEIEFPKNLPPSGLIDFAFGNADTINSYRITSYYETANSHAQCTVDLIEKLLLGRYSFFWRIARYFKIFVYHPKCYRVIESGEIDEFY